MIRLLQFYCAFTVLWFLFNRLWQDAWWALVVLDKFADYFLFASIPLFLLALIIRKKAVILTAIPPLLICAFFYLPFFFVSSTVQTVGEANYLRIATFNIWNHNKDIDAIVSLINSAESDIIAIQEITDVQQTKLTSILSKTYPYYHVSSQVYGGTTALFSRHELHNLIELEFDIDRPAIVADLAWEGVSVTVVSAHLNPSFWAYHQQPWNQIPANYHQYIKDQNTQAGMIISALKDRQNSQAYFLACDCNSQQAASTNRLLDTFFEDAFKSVGWQIGRPNNAQFKFEHNLMHIDYIWHAGNATPTALYRTIESVGSDHEQVVADFLVNQ